MTSKDELREKVEAAIKDGLSNHTGEWFNGWIAPGLNLTEEQLRDLLFYLTKAKRLQDNILNLLEGEKQKARIEEVNRICLDTELDLKWYLRYEGSENMNPQESGEENVANAIMDYIERRQKQLATLNKEPNKGEDV